MTDAQLLGRYVDQRDESAFTALVYRHGSMVWGVCRRVLMNHQDAEDAFQATFLVLVRKARSVHTREKVANWLYGVAYNTALKAKDVGARRKARECQVFEMPESAAACQSVWKDLAPLLDRELSNLPERYRLPIVLCDLEGRTRKEAARQLGWPEGTLSSRLSKARTALAKKLSRHGLGLSVGALTAALSQSAASADVPASVISSTIKAATSFAAGTAAAAGAVSVTAAALTEGVLKDMLMSKLKFATMALLAASFVCMGVSAFRTSAAEIAVAPAAAADPKPEDRARVKWEYKAINATAINKLAPEKSTDKLTDGLNALGDQGWELVAIQASMNSTGGFGGGALGAGGGFAGAAPGGGGIGGGGGGGIGGGGTGGGGGAMSKPTVYLFKRPK
jgi:RNA polymerase sigma factor (sigma-70 family)